MDRSPTHYSGPAAIGLLCLVVALASAIMLGAWRKLDRRGWSVRFPAAKCIPLYALSVVILCFAQILALYLGHGSEYAVRKYVFGLHSVLLVELAVFPGLYVVCRANAAASVDKPDIVQALVLPIVLIAISFVSVIPAHKVISTSSLVSLERQVRLLRATQMASTPDKYDYVVNLAGMPAPIAYMLSIGTLKAPRSANAYDVLSGRHFSEQERVGTIITTANRAPYDVPSCRRLLLSSSLAILDGSCVLSRLATQANCGHAFDFSNTGWIDPHLLEGFSVAEAHGRWTSAEKATFECSLPPEMAHNLEVVRIDTVGFVVHGRPQRVRIAINNTPMIDFVYRHDSEQKTFELPLRNIPLSDRIRVDFIVPDAISPSDLGLSSDPRRIGIGVRSIDFR